MKEGIILPCNRHVLLVAAFKNLHCHVQHRQKHVEVASLFVTISQRSVNVCVNEPLK